MRKVFKISVSHTECGTDFVICTIVMRDPP
jgi:hypothetical protein